MEHRELVATVKSAYQQMKTMVQDSCLSCTIDVLSAAAQCANDPDPFGCIASHIPASCKGCICDLTGICMEQEMPVENMETVGLIQMDDIKNEIMRNVGDSCPQCTMEVMTAVTDCMTKSGPSELLECILEEAAKCEVDCYGCVCSILSDMFGISC